MPKLKDIDISFDQVRNLVSQLDFKKKTALIKEVIKEKSYKKNFYAYAEGLVKKYKIPRMSEKELDAFLHEGK